MSGDDDDDVLDFLCDLGRRLSVATGDIHETAFLLQKLSLSNVTTLCSAISHFVVSTLSLELDF